MQADVLLGLLIPFAGTLLGSLAHKVIPDRYFTRAVYAVLLASGGFMAYSSIPGLFH